MATVKVTSLSNNLYYDDLLDILGEYGQIVQDQDLIPYGVIVRYDNIDNALSALKLSNTEFHGEILTVKLFDKNTIIGGTLHISGLGDEITEKQLAIIFNRFGKIRNIKILKGGKADIEFFNYRDALTARGGKLYDYDVTYDISYNEIPDDGIYYHLSLLDKYGNKPEDSKIIDWLTQFEKNNGNTVIFNIDKNTPIPFSLVDILELFVSIISPHEEYILQSLVEDEDKWIDFKIFVKLNVSCGYGKQQLTVMVKYELYRDETHTFSYSQYKSKEDIWEILINELPLWIIFPKFKKDEKFNIVKENRKIIEQMPKKLKKIESLFDTDKISIKNNYIFNKLPIYLEETKGEDNYSIFIIGYISTKVLSKVMLTMKDILSLRPH